MNCLQSPKKRKITCIRSRLISPKRIYEKNGQRGDCLRTASYQLRHDKSGLLEKVYPPRPLSNALLLKNALDACVVLEPLNFLDNEQNFQLPEIVNRQPDDGSHLSWYNKNLQLDRVVSRCKDIIDKCLTEINKASVAQSDTVKNFVGELESLSSKAELPRTIIALMGGTGTGKSTLINALLDMCCILPTSDDRACTSVVVEVEQNTNKDKFEAVVEFLQTEDWFHELQTLLKDLMCQDGLSFIKPPEYSSDMYVSYCKVKAVYGKIDTFESLSQIESVNQWLGKKHHITCNKSEGENFQTQIESFITAKAQGPNNRCLWPLIKHVLIKMPNVDVCSSGASLVDLPGIGDSNPARNKIAKEYLKECHSVWVISAMTRAIDDITSRSLLDQELRRQLLMDGNLDNLAFICTMSDRFCEHNTIRAHALDHLCHEQTVQKNSLENDKRLLEQFVKSCQNKEGILKAKARIWELHEHIMKKNYAISKICARARNELCIRNIRNMFRNIKRQLTFLPNDHKCEESGNAWVDIMDCKEVESQEEGFERNIRVFCCSSMEYQKLRGINTTDGLPLVFEDADDTQIPALKEYVHELTYNRRAKELESIVRRLGRCVFSFMSYVRNGRNLVSDTSGEIKTTIDHQLFHFQDHLHQIITSLGVSVQELFQGKIKELFIQGANNAKNDAQMICDRWGPLVYKGPHTCQVVGLHWRSYRATVQRRGVFTLYASKTDINFNRALAEPIFKQIEEEWSRLFNLQIPKEIDHTSEIISNETKMFINNLCEQVKLFPISEERVKNINMLLELTISGKISDFLSQTKLEVMKKQRDINRMLTPFIQLRMDDVYINVDKQRGKGSTEKMKKCMLQGLDMVRHTMFDEAIEMLHGELASLQKAILRELVTHCTELMKDMQKTFEPLWKSTNPRISALYSVLNDAGHEIRKIYTDAKLEKTDEVPYMSGSCFEVSPIVHTQDQDLNNTMEQPLMSEWEYSVHNSLRNGTSDEIIKTLSTCPNDEYFDVLRAFDNESHVQKRIMVIMSELLQTRLKAQGYNVSVWPGFVKHKSDYILFCTFKKHKPQVRHFFNKEILYMDCDS